MGFLSHARGIGIVLMLLTMVLIPPRSPLDVLAMLGGIAMLVMLPYFPQVLGPVGLPLCFAATWLDSWSPENVGLVVVAFCLFIAVGYAFPSWVGMTIAAVYALAETVCSVYFGAHGAAVSGTRGFVHGWLGMERTYGPATSGPPGPVALLIAGTIISFLVSGFAVMLGRSFGSNATAKARLKRAEELLGRITREQELAHMIHDSVANDMSTIAMLTWRAKGVEDDTEILDAIYERSHHALNRVHEVIDVLNGKREMEPAPQSAEPVALDIAIEKLMEEQDRLLHMLGFAGSSHLEGDLFDDGLHDVVSPKVHETVMGLLEELYANIVRHCTPAAQPSGYSVVVDLDGDVIRITGINPLLPTPSMMRGIRHGRGLALHRTAVESLGGMLAASVQDGVWILNARIPAI